MLIQCNIQREGNTQIILDKFPYMFQPHPELTGNDNDKVCPVASARHQAHFLSLPDFEQWEAKDEPAIHEDRAELIALAIASIPTDQWSNAKGGRPAMPKLGDISAMVGFNVKAEEVIAILESGNDGSRATG